MDDKFVPRLDFNGDAIVRLSSTDPLVVPGALAWGQSGFSLPDGRIVFVSSSSGCRICNAMGGHNAAGCAVAYRLATTGASGGATPLLSVQQLRFQAAKLRYNFRVQPSRVSAVAEKFSADISQPQGPAAASAITAAHLLPRAARVPPALKVAVTGMGKRTRSRAARKRASAHESAASSAAAAAVRVAELASKCSVDDDLVGDSSHAARTSNADNALQALLSHNSFDALAEAEPEQKEDSDQFDKGGGAFYPGLEEPKKKKLSKKQKLAATAAAGKERTRVMQRASRP